MTASVAEFHHVILLDSAHEEFIEEIRFGEFPLSNEAEFEADYASPTPDDKLFIQRRIPCLSIWSTVLNS